MIYADRINLLKLDSLEERRLRFDIIFTYKIFFGLVNMNCNDMFAFNDFTVTRGHSHKLYAKTSRLNVLHNFFVIVSSTYGIVFPRVTVTLKRSNLLNRS